MITLGYYGLYDDVHHPFFATKGSACFDICAYFDLSKPVQINKKMVEMSANRFCVIGPGDIALIPTGLILDIPFGHSVRLHPRSGLSLSGITLVNCEGVIDADYVNELMVPMINLGKESVAIGHGQRIAQAELMKNYEYEILETKNKPVSITRSGGFGSTGS